MIQLIVADTNLEYLELFASYIRTSHYSTKLIMKSFSNKEYLHQYIQNSDGKFILLVTPELIPDGDIERINTFIILAESSSMSDYPNQFVMNKFQPLDKICSEIISIYLDQNENDQLRIGTYSDTRIVSIFSATGGIGKTTLAINLSIELSKRDYHVFYLNLEYLNSSKIFFEMNTNAGLSELLFYLKADPEKVASKLEGIKRRHPIYNIDYFEPFTNPYEIYEMTMEETETLISKIVNTGNYDYLIVDLDSTPHERNIGALAKSDKILWLVVDDILNLHKTISQLNQINLLLEMDKNDLNNKIRFIVNKYLGTELKNNFMGSNINLTGYLPYIPQWKSVTSYESLIQQDIYNEEIAKLIALLK